MHQQCCLNRLVHGIIVHTMKIVDILGEHHAKHENMLDLTITVSLYYSP